MTLRLNGSMKIHNFRNDPPEAVAELRSILASGAQAESDPRRKGFYAVDGCSRRFYIHTAPDGSVWLLASWVKSVPAAVGTPAVLCAACS